jgi:hypothetical protein
MWYVSIVHLLAIIVQRLSLQSPQDEEEWQAQTAVVQACFEEMGISESMVNQLKVNSDWRNTTDELNRAMPHLQSMLTAMRNHDRTTALAHGERALQRLRDREASALQTPAIAVTRFTL